MSKDNDDDDEIMFKDEDGNIHVIDKEMLQLLEFDIKDLKPNKTGGQIKRKFGGQIGKPKGWGAARYGNK